MIKLKIFIPILIISLSSTIDNEIWLEQEYNKLQFTKAEIVLASLKRQSIPIDYIHNCKGKKIVKKLGLKGDCKDDVNKIALLRWWNEHGWTGYKNWRVINYVYK